MNYDHYKNIYLYLYILVELLKKINIYTMI